MNEDEEEIRVHIHTDIPEESEYEILTRVITRLNRYFRPVSQHPADLLFAMMDMSTVLGPIIDVDMPDYFNRFDQRLQNRKLLLTNEEYNPEKVEEKMCSICYEDFKENEEISTLKCDHIFHATCIERWATIKPNCALCRGEIEFTIDS